jgi:tetratricopeptide (TPR) repeat protein
MATISEALAIAIQHHQAGRLQAAEQIYRQILAAQPDHAEAWHLSGIIACQAGKHAVAIECLQRAIALDGTKAAFHSNLGNVFHDQGRHEEAVECYRRALELEPSHVEAHNNLGNALKDRGKLEEAAKCYRRALELKPDSAEIGYNLAIALTELGELDEAVERSHRVLQLRPNFAEAHNNLGNALKQQGKLDEAVACYRVALELKPSSVEAHNLGTVLMYQGKMNEAVECFRQVVQREFRTVAGNDPQRRPAVAGQPAAQVSRWKAGQNNLCEAFCQLATILRERLPEEDLRAMRQLASSPDLGDEGRAALNFGLAEALDARADFAAAAQCLREANAAALASMQLRAPGHSPSDHAAFISGVIAAFTPQFFARTSGFGLETELPVFIVGLPRTGTTLVEQVLASHSHVFAGGELRYCDDTFQALPAAMRRNDAPLECLPDIDRQTAFVLAERHAERLRTLGGKALRVVDKMPRNYQHLGLIRVLFPQAQVIHCRRDLRDVALSCWMTHFASLPWACDPRHIVSYFQEYARLTDHWRTVLPSPPLVVDYERMVEDLETTARRIIAWCGLAWEDRCLRFHETPRAVQTASKTQVRRPIYKTSVGRWRNYEPWLGELFSRLPRLDAGPAF